MNSPDWIRLDGVVTQNMGVSLVWHATMELDLLFSCFLLGTLFDTHSYSYVLYLYICKLGCPSGYKELPLGMKSGKISDSQITASSHKPECPPSHARLDRLSPLIGGVPCHAWCPAGFNAKETPFKHWIMVSK